MDSRGKLFSTETESSETCAEQKHFTLVLEGGMETAWALPSLLQLIPPHHTVCHLVIEMSDVSHGGWIEAEPETFWEMISQRRRLLQQWQNKFKQQLETHGIQVSAVSITDASHQGITKFLDQLDEERPACVMVATHRKDQPHRKDGTVSGWVTQVAAQSLVPVLVLKHPISPTQKLRVLVATDGSEASHHAIQKLPQLIRMDQGDVTVATVIHPFYAENPILAPYVNTTAITEALEQNAAMILTVTQGMLESQGILVSKTLSEFGSPGWKLLEMIKREKPDVVVMGAHQRITEGPAQRLWLLGSVSQQVLQQGNCSVLLVR